MSSEKDTKFSNLEKISGKDIKRYILSFNYCIENLNSEGIYDSWFDNFFDTVLVKNIKLKNRTNPKHENMSFDTLKDYFKNQTFKTIIKIEKEFIKEQEQWSDELSEYDLDVLYKVSFKQYFKEFVEENMKHFKLNSLFDYSNIDNRNIYVEVQKLLRNCRTLYNLKKKPHKIVDYAERNISKYKNTFISGSEYLVHGIIFKIDNDNNIIGKMVGGSLYPLSDTDKEIFNKYAGLGSKKMYKYRGKLIDEFVIDKEI